jgi:hypothetical protein
MTVQPESTGNGGTGRPNRSKPRLFKKRLTAKCNIVRFRTHPLKICKMTTKKRTSKDKGNNIK